MVVEAAYRGELARQRRLGDPGLRQRGRVAA
jgi:hypothetical protein